MILTAIIVLGCGIIYFGGKNKQNSLKKHYASNKKGHAKIGRLGRCLKLTAVKEISVRKKLLKFPGWKRGLVWSCIREGFGVKCTQCVYVPVVNLSVYFYQARCLLFLIYIFGTSIFPNVSKKPESSKVKVFIQNFIYLFLFI